MTIECSKCSAINPSRSKFCNACATPLVHEREITEPSTKTLDTPLTEVTRGTLFADRYEVIEKLGKGGMGHVYRVYDREIKEDVALKILRPEISADRTSINRFRNELKLSRKISHKNICRMYDISRDKEKYFFTMEYVPGENLKSFLRRSKQLAIRTTISIALQMCEGLAQAHKLGIVHRDLKPSNIMIDREGNVRIMDFGIAQSLMTKGITGTRMVVGTPEYMSPEQAESKEVDNRSDIYSFGILLYEIVSGQLPFEGETPLSVIIKHREQKPRDPKEIRAQIPVSLSRLILKCLEKDRDKRYQDMDELIADLTRIEKGLPVITGIQPKKKPITQKEITVSFKLKKLLVPALLIAGIVILGIIFLPFLPKNNMAIASSNKPRLAVLHFENRTGEEDLNKFCIGLPELLISGLSKSRYLKILRMDEINSILEDLGLLDKEEYSQENLENIAKEGKIDYLVKGSCNKFGSSFTISTWLISSDSGDTLLTESSTAEKEKKIPGKMKKLAMRIIKRIDNPLGVTMETAIDELGSIIVSEEK